MILGILSLIVLLRSPEAAGGGGEKAFWPNPRRGVKTVYVVIALVLYVVGIEYVGFSLATFLFLAYLLRGIEPQRWSRVLIWALLSTVLSYAVFGYWLDVPLSKGIVGF